MQQRAEALNEFCCRHCSALQCNQVALMTQIQPGCVEQERISSLEALVTHACLPHSFGGLGITTHLQEVKNISKQMIMQHEGHLLKRMRNFPFIWIPWQGGPHSANTSSHLGGKIETPPGVLFLFIFYRPPISLAE